MRYQFSEQRPFTSSCLVSSVWTVNVVLLHLTSQSAAAVLAAHCTIICGWSLLAKITLGIGHHGHQAPWQNYSRISTSAMCHRHLCCILCVFYYLCQGGNAFISVCLFGCPWTGLPWLPWNFLGLWTAAKWRNWLAAVLDFCYNIGYYV